MAHFPHGNGSARLGQRLILTLALALAGCDASTVEQDDDPISGDGDGDNAGDGDGDTDDGDGDTGDGDSGDGDSGDGDSGDGDSGDGDTGDGDTGGDGDAGDGDTGDGDTGDGDTGDGDTGDGDTGDGDSGDGDTGDGGTGDGDTGDGDTGDGDTGDGDTGDGDTGDGDTGDGDTGGDGDALPGDCLEDQQDSRDAAVVPPGGLAANKVPMFVMFGFDDNAYADGMNWVVNDLFKGKKNKDGSPARATFFVIGGTATSSNAGIFNDFGGQSEQDLIDSWKNAYAQGHEIGNHTWDHADGGTSRSLADWQTEVDKSNDLLKSKLGIPQCQLAGFRFPYLKFNNEGFTAIATAGYTYDTSMEFGYDWWQPPGSNVGFGSGSPESTKHFWWPFTLDKAPDASFNCCSHGVQPHPGVWEFPAHVFSRPDPGDATHVKAMTGLDYNVWLTAANDSTVDFCETLKYTFKLHYDGNRSPMNAGMHSDIYSEFNETADSGFHNNAQERRAALKCFLDYVLTFEDARVVPFRDVVRWLRNPKPL